MKKAHYIIVILFFSLLMVDARNDKKDFNTGISFYADKEIEQALEHFINLLKEGYDNFEINYNIGCCYYKLDQIGKARFYFERALYYKPFNSDLLHNLTVIYRKVLKNPLVGEQVIMNRRIIFFIPMNIVIIMLLFFIAVSIVFLILTYIIIDKRRLFLIFLTICLVFSFLFTILFFVQNNTYNQKTFVITSTTANVYLAPDEYETILLSISEGSRGKIIEEIDDYIRIRLNDGSSGWMKKIDIISSRSFF
ncbi:MAG: tetratricopeptide repeat protein [Spirochaetes bacterium]|nr:tetratricopeptide repeat protein [Spirochaetota bacterium]